MFKPAIKSELSQVSLTGMRAIVLLGLLTEAPRTLKEIRNIFIGLNIMEENHSDDIIRIDLNTLRSVGCEITKATHKTNYNYVLEKSVFSINFTLDEIDVLRKAYKKVKNSSDIALLLKYHSLLENITEYVSDNELKELIYGISVLKSFNISLVKELLEYCESHKLVKLMYFTPGKQEHFEKNILVQKLNLNNDKIYLYGYDIDKKRSVILNVQRIKSIISSTFSNNNIEIQETFVKFKLKKSDIIELNENEKIIEIVDDCYIVEACYYNDFIAIQRILSFGANCIVLEPSEFRNKIIEKLKSMKDVYND